MKSILSCPHFSRVDAELEGILFFFSSVFIVTCQGVQWFGRSNRLQFLVGLQHHLVMKKPLQRSEFHLIILLLTVTNERINTPGVQQKKSPWLTGGLKQRALALRQNTACIIAHQLTREPFIHTDRTHTHANTCMHTHSQQQGAFHSSLSSSPTLRGSISEQTVL